jgi:hypothetical protein
MPLDRLGVRRVPLSIDLLPMREHLARPQVAPVEHCRPEQQPAPYAETVVQPDEDRRHGVLPDLSPADDRPVRATCAPDRRLVLIQTSHVPRPTGTATLLSSRT